MTRRRFIAERNAEVWKAGDDCAKRRDRSGTGRKKCPHGNSVRCESIQPIGEMKRSVLRERRPRRIALHDNHDHVSGVGCGSRRAMKRVKVERLKVAWRMEVALRGGPYIVAGEKAIETACCASQRDVIGRRGRET